MSQKRAPSRKTKTVSTIIPQPFPTSNPSPTEMLQSPTVITYPTVVTVGQEEKKQNVLELTSDEISSLRKMLVTFTEPLLSVETEEEEEDDEEDELEDVDLFVVETENFLGSAVKEIIFPKFLKNTQRVDQKSNLYFSIHGEPKVYAQLLKLVASDEPLKPLVIKLYEPNEAGTDVVIAVTYEFPTPTLLAIDFGNLSHAREKPREIRVEFDFNHFKIDNVDFFC